MAAVENFIQAFTCKILTFAQTQLYRIVALPYVASVELLRPPALLSQTQGINERGNL
jgi:hypothetical protein